MLKLGTTLKKRDLHSVEREEKKKKIKERKKGKQSTFGDTSLLECDDMFLGEY
jgi:hypothetical protein